MTFRVIQLRRRCDEHAAITTLTDDQELCPSVNDINITPADVAQKLASNEDLVLIDVREPYEWTTGHIESAHHIPLQQIPQRLAEIPKDREVVMICRSGGRSEHARAHLAQLGYTRVRNMIGGMQRWAREVDPTMRVA